MITLAYIIFFPLLFVLSCVYGAVVWLIVFFYKRGILKSYRPQAVVISVGNITVGGSGKTPLVEYLATCLAKQGRRVAILLRGYKKPKSKKACEDDFVSYGDEGAMLKRNLGERALVKIGSDRGVLARRLDHENSCDTMILDDGFQHWRIKRDLDIVAIDVTRPFGNRFLLPAGHLRESLSSLKRAQIFCMTRCDEVLENSVEAAESILKRINPAALIIRTRHRPESVYKFSTGKREGLGILKDTKVGLFCGIANPDSFLKVAKNLGSDICFHKFFQDHHIYHAEEIIKLIDHCAKQGASYLVTTEKDAARLGWIRSCEDIKIDLLVLKVSLEVLEGKEALDGRLHSLYNR